MAGGSRKAGNKKWAAEQVFGERQEKQVEVQAEIPRVRLDCSISRPNSNCWPEEVRETLEVFLAGPGRNERLPAVVRKELYWDLKKQTCPFF